MLEALWSLEVLVGDRPLEAGVLFFQPQRLFGDFFESGRVVGGGRGCCYVGRYQIENLGVRAELRVLRYAGDTDPVFGAERELLLRVVGRLDRHVRRDVFELAAERPGSGSASMRLRLIRRAEV